MEKRGQKERTERAARVKHVRETLGLTQEVFAERLGVQFNTYKMVESGTNNLSLDMMIRLKETFGISVDYLLFGEAKTLDDVWFLVKNCEEYEKMKIMWRLLQYFCYQKVPVIKDNQKGIEKILNDLDVQWEDPKEQDKDHNEDHN